MLKALEGIRVLDLSRMLPGPFCSMMLADLGAEVIKVEEPSTGDPTRWSPPMVGNHSAAFLQVNRNKKSLALNLKEPEGRDIFLKLAASSDVVLEQFRPGVAERLGIGYRAVAEVNARIIYCSLTGFGQNGPHRDRSGHDLNYIALSGVLGLTTDRAGEPVIPGVQIADLAGGMIAAFATLAAIIARARTGRGQFLDVSMLDVMLSMLAIPAANQFAGRSIGVGDKYGLSGAYPFYNVYETSDGRYMTLGALEPKFWQNFCRKVEREELIARQFDEGPRRAELFEQVRAIFKSRTQAEWVELMREADACCEPVLTMAEAFEHAQTRARAMVVELSCDDKARVLGPPYKMSETPAQMTAAVPALGEHTNELLAALGIAEPERERLARAGVTRAANTAESGKIDPPLRV
jgi:crotonobetainyl-CoA:carnitine CoA-transferase CaiB-like acyl-CoA transferase